MPTIDFTCQQCGHEFQQIALRGEPVRPVDCPRCRSAGAKPVIGSASLFDGIAPFRGLAEDTN